MLIVLYCVVNNTSEAMYDYQGVGSCARMDLILYTLCTARRSRYMFQIYSIYIP